MLIRFGLSHVFCPQSDAVEDSSVLRTLLECLVKRDLTYLRYHAAPELYSSRVVYGRTEEWEDIGAIRKRGYGDCKSLSSWRIAELVFRKEYRLNQLRPVFRWVQRRDGSGVKDFHILVQTPKGYECPSRVLGMGKEENYFRGGMAR